MSWVYEIAVMLIADTSLNGLKDSQSEEAAPRGEKSYWCLNKSEYT